MFERIMSYILVMATGISGCAATTPFHPLADGTGYSSRQISEDQYWISYTANSFTTEKTLKKYLLYRAAQLALETDHENFVVINSDPAPSGIPDYVENDRKYYRHHDFQHHHLWFGDGISSDEFSTVPSRSLTQNAEAIMIRVFSGVEPPEEGRVYIAKEVIELLGNSVTHPTSH